MGLFQFCECGSDGLSPPRPTFVVVRTGTRLRSDRDELPLAPDINGPIGDRGRGHQRFSHRKSAGDGEVRSGRHDEDVAVFTREVDRSVGGNR